MAHEQITKLKKRQWFQIIAPKQFESVVLGETLVYEPGAMLGKSLSHNLMNLSNDPKRQNINIHFKVVEVQGDKGITSIIGYEIVPSSVKRFIRRNSEKMDMSFTCETADNVFVRVKPLVITKADVKGSVAAKMRNMIVQFLAKTIKKMSYDEVLNELISHKLQSLIRENFHKVYPLKVCEIRYFGIEAREHSSALPVQIEKPQETNQEEANPELVAEAKEAKLEEPKEA